jgi:hypothetical protein
MKFFRKQPGTPFLTTNGMTKFFKELKVESSDEKLRRCKLNWLLHVTRRNNRMPKIMLGYRSNGL